MQIPVYEVDKDVVPPEPSGSVPLELLEVGDSILFDLEKRNNTQSKASHMKAKTGKNFTIKQIDEHYARVWRIA